MKAALNGNRAPGSHPYLPVSPTELAEAAADSVVAGAGALHLHPRDAAGRESLAPEDVGRAVEVSGSRCRGLGSASRPAASRFVAILWRRLDRPRHEFARAAPAGTGWSLSGTAVFLHEGAPCRLDYDVRCNEGWETTSGRVTGRVGSPRSEPDREVFRDGLGRGAFDGLRAGATLPRGR